jgi:hypothetical protein
MTVLEIESERLTAKLSTMLEVRQNRATTKLTSQIFWSPSTFLRNPVCCVASL